MPNVLIRDVPADDLAQMRSAAAARGVSLQAYLLAAMHAQAAHLRRQETLNRVAARLADQPAVTEHDRTAVLDAMDDALADRGAQLSSPK